MGNVIILFNPKHESGFTFETKSKYNNHLPTKYDEMYFHRLQLVR